jgi:hypothetical protein
MKATLALCLLLVGAATVSAAVPDAASWCNATGPPSKCTGQLHTGTATAAQQSPGPAAQLACIQTEPRSPAADHLTQKTMPATAVQAAWPHRVPSCRAPQALKGVGPTPLLRFWRRAGPGGWKVVAGAGANDTVSGDFSFDYLMGLAVEEWEAEGNAPPCMDPTLTPEIVCQQVRSLLGSGRPELVSFLCGA